jgi:hypothetical protein
MTDNEEVVTLKDAIEQVKTAVTRIALIHLGFSKTLVEELGEKKGKELIIKSMIEYGKLVGKQTGKGRQDLPYYGLHDKYLYDDHEFIDTRKSPVVRGKDFDFTRYRVYGCMLAKIFRELGEEDLGRLYCYVDSAKSMATDPSHKLIHTACEPIGDDCCRFDLVPTTEKEREDFTNKTEDWKEVDPILVKGSSTGK